MSKRNLKGLTHNEALALSKGVNFVGCGVISIMLIFMLSQARRAGIVPEEYTSMLLAVILSSFLVYGFTQLRAFKFLLDTDKD